MVESNKVAKSGKVTGRRKGRIARHFDRAPVKKLRRVLKTSGLNAGRAYIKAKGLYGPAVAKLVAEPRWETREAGKRTRAIKRRDRYEVRRATRDAAAKAAQPSA